MLPDYRGHSLLNLVASLVAARGGTPRHPTLAALPPAELAQARNVVFLIIDGLGDDYLRRRGAGGELARRRRAAITSVFPSTTASAITTSYTGASPLEHGLTGWFAYFGEAGCVGAPLPFMSRGDALSLSRRGVTPSQLFTERAYFEELEARAIVVTYRDIIDSPYNVLHCAGAERVAYERIEDLPAELERVVKSGSERKFIYAYWPDYDRWSHRFGSESAEAEVQLAKLDEAFGRALARLAGTETMVVASADHGFVDVPPECSLELPARLAAMLRFPLCGERRAAYCHVHAVEAFLEEAGAWLGDRGVARPSGELVEEGWFGPGRAHARFAERIGDVALVMNGRYTIKDWVAGEARHLHIGNHGGTSEAEMTIPLIVERT